MLEIAIMIEGQNGLTWPRWQSVVELVEGLGFVGLYRSDHFTNANPPDQESLELWVSLTWLAAHTKRIEFGPLVTPFSFRHPALTARMAAAVDDLSDGRLTLGLGAGWQVREHDLFGFDLLDASGRFARFEEGVECVTQLLRSGEPFTFDGEYYRFHDAQVLPRPKRGAELPILIGGTGEKRTLPLAARYADEWNATFLKPDEFSRLNVRLNELLQSAGRRPESVRRSMMTRCIFAKDESALGQKLASQSLESGRLRAHGVILGTGAEVKDQLAELSDAGLQRIMLQWLELDDLDGLRELAGAVL